MAGSWRPVRRLLGTAAAIAFVSGFLTGSAMAQSNSGRAVFSTGADFSHACFSAASGESALDSSRGRTWTRPPVCLRAPRVSTASHSPPGGVQAVATFGFSSGY